MVLEHDYKNFPELTNTQLETHQFSSPYPQIIDDFSALVVKVHDGDTITLRASFRDFDFPLRILNIDAPELSEGGDLARDWLKDLLEGQVVTVRVDPSQRVGKYGRLLGLPVYGGLDVAESMLSLGLVVPFGSKNEGHVPMVGKLMMEASV